MESLLNVSPRRWIYALILTIDANFKMSLKEKGIKDDPALGDAWAHWVPREEFYDYLRNNGGAVEVCCFAPINTSSLTSNILALLL